MIKQLKNLFILSLALVYCSLTYGQIKRERQADKNFQTMSYVNAIDIYERIANKGYINESVLKNLADAYYFNGLLIEANKWYEQLFQGDYPGKDTSQLSSEYLYRYAQTLKAIENYDKAQEIMGLFVEIESQDARAEFYKANKDYLEQIKDQSDRYKVELVDFNTDLSDYGSTIVQNQLIFTSARSDKKTHSWTNENFTSLYASEIGEDGFGEPVLFAPEIGSKVNDATAVFTKDGNTMFFTRNNSKSNGKSKQNRKKKSLLKIYKASKDENGLWGQVQELPFNSDNFNTAHPALTPDEKWLYFASDRKSTFGQSDLYRVALLEDGQYGELENLGQKINTPGRESFPFISSDNHLYFASDGHPGLGGLDVFVTKISGSGNFGDVQNIGAPVNSNLDDFAFYLDVDTNKGFVSSNRLNGVGGDDIYFVALKPCQVKIQGTIFDQDSNEVLANAIVVISDALYQKSDTLTSDSNGFYSSEWLPCNTKYRILAQKQDYLSQEVVLAIDNTSGVVTQDIGLNKTNKPIGVDDDLFKALALEPIYFNFDKSNIRNDASIELSKVVEVLKLYPTMKIDVRSHTDSRGNDAYNMSLSDRRVKSTIKWMIEQGIEPERLSGRGYGESQLQNNCSNGVNCSEKDHQLNRRSEFIILQM
ncbi:OmpA family protein [Myroides sp. LJL115]